MKSQCSSQPITPIISEQNKKASQVEAAADQSLWLWHAYSGLSGSANDIHVHDTCPIFLSLLQGRAPGAEVTVNANLYTFPCGRDLSEVRLSCTEHQQCDRTKTAAIPKCSRSCRKRAFGGTETCWVILKLLCRVYSREAMHSVVMTCIIFHDMIVEVERGCEDLSL